MTVINFMEALVDKKLKNVRERIQAHNGQYRGMATFEQGAVVWEQQRLELQTELRTLMDLWYEAKTHSAL